MPDDEGLALHAAGSRAARSVRCSRSGRTAGSRRCTSARPRAKRARCCSRSTITAVRRRTRPVGTTTTPKSSIPRPGRWTRCRSSGARSTRPTSKTSWSRSSATRSRSRGCGRRRSASSSSTAATPKTSRSADYARWSPHVAPGGVLAIHDVFEDPGRRRPGAVPRVGAGGGRRLRADRDHRIVARAAQALSLLAPGAVRVRGSGMGVSC